MKDAVSDQEAPAATGPCEKADKTGSGRTTKAAKDRVWAAVKRAGEQRKA